MKRTIETNLTEEDIKIEGSLRPQNLDDYIGFYADGDCNEITIDKEGDDYIMEVTIFRLTDIDEGIVSATSEGVVFDATDAAGDPIKLLFREAGDEMYELVIEDF